MPFEKVFTNGSGHQVRILISNYALTSLVPQFGIDVFTQNEDGVNWDLCVQTPEAKKSSNEMSVDEFVRMGRHPMWYAITFGDLVRATNDARCHYGYQPI